MRKWIWTLLLAGVLAGPTELARAEDAAEPTPETLAQTWFDQRSGGDAIEIWSTEWAGFELRYAVARRWVAGQPEVFVHILAPREYDELNLLLRERSEGRLELLYYRSPKVFPNDRKAGRVVPAAVPTPTERLPFAPGLPAISGVLPMRARDFGFARLPDAAVANQPCRVIEGRPRAAGLGFDRVRFSLARETGVALETVWLRGEDVVLRVAVDPSDVRDTEGRMLPTRESVERPATQTQVFSLSRLMLDPPLPDQLFSTKNLKLGRLPSY